MHQAQARIDRIEALIHRDMGRGMDEVFAAARGGLWRAALALGGSGRPSIGLITGFFVPGGDPPSAETDGPAGAALMVRGFAQIGLACRVATDTICQSACRVALDAAGAGSVPVDAMAPGGSVDGLIERWRHAGIDWIIAIERCGPAADGIPRNMRGTNLSGHVAPLERLFSAGPWRTIGIGDGGNEIGMGSVSRALITQHVPVGAAIGCVVPADHLIAAGVSHWGAYAALGALAVVRAEWSAAISVVMDAGLDRSVVEAMVRDGPAVDGVTLRREVTIDGLGMDVHRGMMEAIREIVFERKPEVNAC